MVLDLVTNSVQLTPEKIRQLSDRHFGIGFDQLLQVELPGDPTVDAAEHVGDPGPRIHPEHGGGVVPVLPASAIIAALREGPRRGQSGKPRSF